MEMQIELAFRNEPNLNGFYLPQELYEKSIKEYLDKNGSIPVTMNYSEIKDQNYQIIGEIYDVDFENNLATGKISIDEKLDDFCLGYCITCGNFVEQNDGIKEIKEPIKFLNFSLIPKADVAYKPNEPNKEILS